MKRLTLETVLHLQAAEGWLELGNYVEANAELDKITPQKQAHPDVLEVRWKIYAKAGKWEACADIAQALCKLVPRYSVGFIHLAHSLHEMKRTKEALNTLLPGAHKFPDEWQILYNLACYFCQVGELKESLQWLERAFAVSGKAEIKTKALEDRDLEPLWKQFGEI